MNQPLTVLRLFWIILVASSCVIFGSFVMGDLVVGAFALDFDVDCWTLGAAVRDFEGCADCI
jgi:hypothetical protein